MNLVAGEHREVRELGLAALEVEALGLEVRDALREEVGEV